MNPKSCSTSTKILGPSLRLRDFFQTGFQAVDIAEPLHSFELLESPDSIAARMRQLGLTVVALRRDGLPVAYAFFEDDNFTTRPFDTAEVIIGSTPLHEVVLALAARPRVFVNALGQIAGVIIPDCIQKPPGRIWIFGLITLLEMRMSALLERLYDTDEWQEYLPASRLAMARRLQEERTRNERPCSLLECLQMGDKGRILARNRRVLAALEIDSRRQFKKEFRTLEQLRNSIAHAQDLVPYDWEAIVQLAGTFDMMMLKPKVQRLLEEDGSEPTASGR
jgi:hypothetical protein